MRIGVDVRCLMNGNYSGVSWYAYYLLNNLFELDQANQYILFYNSSKKVRLPEFNFANVSWRGCRYPNKIFNASLMIFNRPRIDRLLGGVDVFFTPNLHFIALSDKCQKVMAVHDLSFIRYPQFFTIKMRWWHRLILWKNILGRADIIVADSQSTKNDLISLLGIAQEKIKVVYLGVENKYGENISAEQLASVKQKYHLPEKFILTLGALEPRKNLAGVIAAYKSLNTDIALVIAGSGGWKNKSLRRSAIDDKRINFIGYVDEADKPALYRSASLLIYPSFYEGFGLPILEAMASGCPVICGNNSSQGEIATDAALLVNPYNTNEIKTAMEALLSDDLLRQRLVEKGRVRAQQFSWKKTAQKMMEIFESV